MKHPEVKLREAIKNKAWREDIDNEVWNSEQGLSQALHHIKQVVIDLNKSGTGLNTSRRPPVIMNRGEQE